MVQRYQPRCKVHRLLVVCIVFCALVAVVTIAAATSDADETEGVASSSSGDVYSGSDSSISADGVTSAVNSNDLTSQGQKNIVKRARQQYEIKWTCQRDIAAYEGGQHYGAGITYQGVPYSQLPSTGTYVPWNISLEEFKAQANDKDSSFYNSSGESGGPYLGSDCSAFVSWAWQLSERANSSTFSEKGIPVPSQTVSGLEVGDALVKSGYHVALVTDVGYDSQGTVVAVEVMEQTPPHPQRTVYGAGDEKTLDTFTNRFFGSGYSAYRLSGRDNVQYTHSCAVPLSGDVCDKCGTVASTAVNGETVTAQRQNAARSVNGYSKVAKAKEIEPVESDTAAVGTASAASDATADKTAFDEGKVFIKSADSLKSGTKLSWDKVDRAVSYQVERSIFSRSGFKPVGTVKDTTFIDYGLPKGTYYYKVRALIRNENDDQRLDYAHFSDIISCQVIEEYDCFYDAMKDSKVTIESKEGKYLKVSWPKVNGAKGYELIRSEEDGPMKIIATVNNAEGDTISYDDKTAEFGKQYYYRAWFFRQAEEGEKVYGDPSKRSKGTIEAINTSMGEITVGLETGNSVKIQWEPVKNATEYWVYRAYFGADKRFEHIATVENADHYLDENLPYDMECYYRVIPVKVEGEKYSHWNYSNVVNITTACYLYDLSGELIWPNTVHLYWQSRPEAVRYDVYRGMGFTFPNGTPVVDKIGSISAKKGVTSDFVDFYDKNLTFGLKYSYSVRPVMRVDGKEIYGPYTTPLFRVAIPVKKQSDSEYL